MNFLRRLLGNKEVPPTPKPANSQNSAPEVVSKSIYPPSDELQRLVCMNCGQPFDTTTVPGLRQGFQDAVKEVRPGEKILPSMGINCVKCRKINLVSIDDNILKRVYHPVKEKAEAIAPPPLVPRPLSELANDTGHLKCQHCGKVILGYSVQGSLLMLEQSDQKYMWFACETCKETSVVSQEELRGRGVKVT